MLQFLGRSSSQSEDSRPSKNTAIYYSKNKETNTAFHAEVPAGSRHAARLQKICANVDPDVAKVVHAPARIQEVRPATRYITQGSVVLPTEGVPAQGSVQSVLYVNGRAQYPVEGSQYTTSTVRQGVVEQPTSSVLYSGSRKRYPDEGSQYSASSASSARTRSSNTQYAYEEDQSQQSQTTTPSVYRYEIDGQVAYHKKSSRGETFISAPLGSVEAQTMDAVAQRRARGTAVASEIVVVSKRR